MHYLILSVLFLLLLYAALQAFLKANPKNLARGVRKAGGIALLALAAFFAVTGRLAIAAPLFLFALPMLGRGFGGFNPFGGNPDKTGGQKSRVRTETVEMELDHDTGGMDGTVLKGTFAKTRLSSMTQEELVALRDECSEKDPQAAQLLEAYLDRNYSGWRGEGASSGDKASGRKGAAGGKMTIEEALEILGLEPDATRADIRRAHRTLMKKLHPDHGGSTYLAAKINQAKDLLLGEGGAGASRPS